MKTAKIGSLWIEGPLSWLEQASISSFVALGHDYTLFTYGEVENVPEGARIRDAREIWPNDSIIVHGKENSPAIHADVFRAILTADTDIVWADTDILALRPFPAALKWFIGYETDNKLGNAIMGFPRGAQTSRRLREFLTSPAPIPEWFNERGRKNLLALLEREGSLNLGDLTWGTTGPAALTYYAGATGEIAHAQPPGRFFPVSFNERKMLVDPKLADALEARLQDEDVLCVHLYSRWMRKYTRGRLPRAGSWIARYLVEKRLVSHEDLTESLRKQRENRKGRVKASVPQIDAEAFFDDLDRRKATAADLACISRHGRVTAVTMAKDEGPYILEWVAFHHLAGFTDMLVYTNDSTDGTDEMLDALATVGLVSRQDNPPMGSKPPQSRALQRAQAHPLVQRSDWIMVLDFDEFLSIRTDSRRIDDLIDIVIENEATAMSLTWRFFGSNGIARVDDRPVTSRFLGAARTDFVQGYGIKTLFRAEPDLRLAIHRPHLSKEARSAGDVPLRWVNGSGRMVDGRVMTWRQTRRSVGYGFGQVNHYGVKSGEEYLMRRLRGDVLNNHGKYDDAYFSKFDRNDVADHHVADLAPRLAEVMERLRSIPAVREAEALVGERYAEKLARLRASEGYEGQMKALGFDLSC